MEKYRSLSEVLYEKINGKTVICTFILTAIIGILQLGIFNPYFLKQTGGVVYLETDIFYTTESLYDSVESYGESGRRLYIRNAVTLDFILPLFCSMFITSLLIFMLKKTSIKPCLATVFFSIGLFSCLSDWIENVFMIFVVTAYPQRVMTYAVGARIMTTVKMLFLAVIIVVAVALLLCYKRHNRNYENVA